MFAKGIRIAAIVTNVGASVDRFADAAETFFTDRSEKVARIPAPVETRFCYQRRIEPALRRETRFLGRVIERAHHKVFAIVTLRPARQLFIFVGEAPHHLRPRNIRASRGTDRQQEIQRDESSKSCAGPYPCTVVSPHLALRVLLSQGERKGERRAVSISRSGGRLSSDEIPSPLGRR